MLCIINQGNTVVVHTKSEFKLQFAHCNLTAPVGGVPGVVGDAQLYVGGETAEQVK